MCIGGWEMSKQKRKVCDICGEASLRGDYFKFKHVDYDKLISFPSDFEMCGSCYSDFKVFIMKKKKIGIFENYHE